MKDRWPPWRRRWERLNGGREAPCFPCGVGGGAETEATHAAPGGVFREPGLGRTLPSALSSRTETRGEATAGPRRRKAGQKRLPSTTAMEHARRVLGDELINNWTPRCLQTSAFSKVVAEIHKLFPRCQIPRAGPR